MKSLYNVSESSYALDNLDYDELSDQYQANITSRKESPHVEHKMSASPKSQKTLDYLKD
jgi:hypothetical protein